LRRAPKRSDLAHWVSLIESGITPQAIYFSFVNSQEYGDLKANAVRTMFPPGHYYSPIVDPGGIEKYVEAESQSAPGDLRGVTLDEQEMVNHWISSAEFIKAAPFSDDDDGVSRYYFNNNQFSYGDAITLYAMMMRYRPRKIIEIGAGFSSACILDTADHAGLEDFSLMCIEPHGERLRAILRASDHSRVERLEKPVQEAPVEIFAGLKENDILFIDSTHVLKTASDVHFELSTILPSLNKGVLVHIHDIYFPFEYPHKWLMEDNRSWNESYALRLFLMFNREFEVVFWNDFFVRRQRRLVEATNPKFLANPGGSFWLRRQ
jgi:predicted O-methyltransferase YrrM